jgi:hypothetical protein
MNKYILSVFLLLFLSHHIYSQEGWKLVKDKESIKVYTRKTEESKFVEFRGITQMEGKISSFVAIMRDADNMTNWVYSIVEGKLLDEPTDTSIIYYAESKLPWPFDNRDAVYHDVFKWDPNKRILIVAIDCKPGYVPEKKGKVRIPYATGYWKVEEISKGNLKITFQMNVDPGGSIPAWLVNAFVVDSPYETLQELKNVIREEKYQKTKYDTIY